VPYLYLSLAAAFNISAYVVFKSISGQPHGGYWAAMFALGLALGGINTGLFTMALSRLALSTAYPIFAGASFAGIMLVGAVVFRETLSTSVVLGTLIVALGIWVITR
jgi:multidrug transporter EmrE-like cation transporter